MNRLERIQKMKHHCIYIFTLAILSMSVFSASAETNRAERRAILSGNKLYEKGDLKGAANDYTKALTANPGSAEARFNLGLSQVQIAATDTTDKERSMKMLQDGMSNLENVAKLGKTKPSLASKANYNMGNVAFMAQQYKEALQYYKQALRLNPADNAARRNLRITQKKLQQQDNNQDQQQQDQQQEQEQQQEQQQQQQPQQQEPQKQDNRIDEMTADQILKSIENKEDQTRAAINKHNNAQNASGNGRARKNW